MISNRNIRTKKRQNRHLPNWRFFIYGLILQPLLFNIHLFTLFKRHGGHRKKIIMTDGVKLKSSRRMKKQIQEDFFNYMCKVARVERADR